MAETLGRLEKVNLRKFWIREDTDFTPWLAKEENIVLLGETIGIELEVLEQEANIGPFRADILCKDLTDNSLVLIENQLEKTDHTHLGQLLTYAAGRDAVTLIWVVEKITEEHRAALDWLNRITNEKIHFFGLEIELWRIGDSNPAPKFNLSVKPNEWFKKIKEATDASFSHLSVGQQLQVDYWASFGKFLTKHNISFKTPKPYPSNWMGYGIGRAGASLIIVFKKTECIVRVETDGNAHPGWFHLLLQQREEIESELGYNLIWEDRPDNKFSFISITSNFDSEDRDRWPKIHVWMSQKMEEFRKVFGPRVKALDDNEWSPEQIDQNLKPHSTQTTDSDLTRGTETPPVSLLSPEPPSKVLSDVLPGKR